ncbi:hypothetical protein ACFFGH_11080 [Lysobacter korlensis]|uniref:DUF7882 domain-containing protein n=1 Tax=Lysobacter korlensis TaxID=553636 RepID=A0ABV6RR15_9GAMM
MGTLFYGAQPIAIRIEDVLLRHLELVITSKLRRGEGLTLSWHDDATPGDGRSTVWINPSTDLHYRFSGSLEAHLDRELLEELSVAAASNGGIRIMSGALAPTPAHSHKAERSPASVDDGDGQPRTISA